ncbi:MAG: hypothetical protein NC086_03860 [Alistipes sp.]|nr:hypothetical protein [Alistipes sp.]
MKSEKLLDAIGQIDDELIYDAVSDTKPNKNNKRFLWGALTAAAACLAAAILIYVAPPFLKRQDLPLLTISEDLSGGMGFEGYLAYDVSELIDANPWNKDMNLSTLPVFENPLTYDEYYNVSGADFDAMENILTDIANRLGMDTDALEITDDMPSEEEMAFLISKYASVGEVITEEHFKPTRILAESDGIQIEVEMDRTATISFDPAVPLPAQYHFSYHASYEDTAAAAGYLLERYADFLDMEKPQVNIRGGDYNIYAQQNYNVSFFDAAGDETEQILNYNFNRIDFYGDENGQFYLARVFRPDLSKKAGDYPVISAAKAQELLLAGSYITTVPYTMPGESYIAKTDLVYRAGKYEKYFMPYYRFLVELPEAEREGGLKTYGAFYVPAVSEDYISNMPVWDGSFNQ